MTYLDENRQQAKLMEYRKELLANVSIFDGKAQKLFLMWLNQCAHTAINAKMSLRELIVAKSGPIVSTQVQYLRPPTHKSSSTFWNAFQMWEPEQKPTTT